MASRALAPVLGPLAPKLAPRMTGDFLGFWHPWHLEGAASSACAAWE